MRKDIILTIVLSILPLWWIFQILWLPGYMHLLADFSYRFSQIHFSTQTAALARERAYEYATLGGGNSDDIYFTKNEISHLNDVSRLFQPISVILNILAVVGWSVLFLAAYKKTHFDKAFIYSAQVLTGLLIFLSVSLLFFSVFFEKFHMILFPQGNWAFPADSLLITIFPESFWKLELLSILVLLSSCTALYWILGKRTHD